MGANYSKSSLTKVDMQIEKPKTKNMWVTWGSMKISRRNPCSPFLAVSLKHGDMYRARIRVHGI